MQMFDQAASDKDQFLLILILNVYFNYYIYKDNFLYTIILCVCTYIYIYICIYNIYAHIYIYIVKRIILVSYQLNSFS